ncbi:hypothetical protein B0H14DRAFT_3451485 [Mycena olivaceomarginata]|nr:hypothetical protein B0H14DRAFT_3451485 [Mycena olivaceomarginata]
MHLAKNIVSELAKLQISAFAYCRESIADARRSGANLVDEIKACGRWEVICVDPEHLQEREMANHSGWAGFLRARLLYSTIDEAHLINIWGAEFRESFAHIGRFFRGCFPNSTSVVALTATLAPGAATSSVCTLLGLFDGAFHLIRRSNEHPNVQFIMQTLTHGLTGYEFPDLLPFLNTGRKICIHCATLDLVFRVYVYICLCPAAYNDETIHLIDNDSQCQIVICTVAFTNGINAQKLRDSISLGFAKTVDIMWQEKGHVAAIKQLEGTPICPNAPAKRHKAVMLKKPRAPMETVKAQFLIEKRCYYAFLNRHYANPPLELTNLDSIAAKRPPTLPTLLNRFQKNYHLRYTSFCFLTTSLT